MREYSELLWLSLKALVSVEEPISVEDAPLRSSPGEKINMYPQMILVLG